MPCSTSSRARNGAATTLHANHAYLKNGLDTLGYNVEASKSQIIALEAGDIRQTTTLRDALESRGVFGAIFFPPATPEKRCLIRFTLNCGLSRARARPHHRRLRRDSRGGGHGRVALDAAQGGRRCQGTTTPGSGLTAAAMSGSGSVDSGRLHDWQVYREGGADVDRGPARRSCLRSLR